jgi:hypothetical protein
MSCCGAVSRRNFLGGAVSLPAIGAAAPESLTPKRRPLVIQPVLIYQIYKRREQTSWRPWGGLFTEKEVAEEKDRIGREMEALKKSADFGMEIAPLRTATTVEEGRAAGAGDHDLLLMIASCGPGKILEAVSAGQKWTVVFVRHQSGPVSEWYEIVSPRFLRKTADEFSEPKIGVEDVVVDNMQDVLMRCRALYGLKNTLGRRIVALGGASGWGAGGKKAPEVAKEVWKLDIVPVTYQDLGQRLQVARQDEARVKRTRALAAAYLADKSVKLETKREYVENAFLLTDVLRGIVAELEAEAITINSCMSTIMPIGETTACLPLSLLNDEGLPAFCESDFVVIPSGILMNAVSGRPVFLNDPTYPHHGLITLAHCTAPRKLDGRNREPVRVLTHFESDYGAAVKVEMRKGQVLTNLIPDFSGKRWVGFKGTVLDNPFLPICRSQIDCGIEASTERLAAEMRGFHWMTGYGDYRPEMGYALKKAGVEWLDLTRT